MATEAPPSAPSSATPLIPAASAQQTAPSSPQHRGGTTAPPSNLKSKMDALAEGILRKAPENALTPVEHTPEAKPAEGQSAPAPALREGKPPEPPAGSIGDPRLDKKAKKSTSDSRTLPPKAEAKPEVKPLETPAVAKDFKGLADMLKGTVEPTPTPSTTEFSTPESLDKEIDAITASGDIKERTGNAFKKTRALIKTQAEELATLRQQLEEVKKTTKAAELDPETKELIEEGRANRWLTAPETQKEVKERFDPVIAGHDESILQVLVKNGAQADLIQSIRNVGGWKGLTTNQAYAGQAKEFYDALPWQDQKLIDAKMAAMSSTEQEKNNFITQGKANAARILAEKSQRGQQQTVQQQQQSEAVRQATTKYVSDLIGVHPVFKKVEIPANASKAQRDILEKRATAQEAIKAALPRIYDNDPHFLSYIAKTFLDTLSAYETIASREYDQLAENADLRARLKAYENVAPGAPRSTSGERRENVEEPPREKPKINVALGQSAIGKGLDDAVRRAISARGGN